MHQLQKIKSSLAGLMAALLILGLTATAQTARAEGWYAGVGFGKFQDEVVDDDDSAWKLYAGLQLHRNFALEVGYVDLGTIEGNSGGTNVTIEQRGLTMAALLIFPLGDSFSVFGKAGGLVADNKISSGVNTFGKNEREVEMILGGGIKFDLGKSVSLRAEFETFENDTGDMFSAGVMMKF